MKGRKPKPTAFRLIEGNREHRTIHQELEPKPASSKPSIPKVLSPEARKHWKYILRHLEAMDTLGESDQGTIMAAAMAYGQVCDVQSQIKGLMAKDELKEDDAKALSSCRRLLVNTMSAMVKYEADLGLNPTARTRIKLDKPVKQDFMERLLS